jgi:leader peptidase (prepilin peptidase)/N-methyltransferase
LVGLAFAGFTFIIGLRPVLVAHLAMVAVTAMLIVTDFDHFRIPNSLLYPGTVASFILLGVGVAFENTWGSLVRGLIGAGIYFGLLFLVFLAAKGEGFGFGDVKLAALLGLFAGYHSYLTLAWALIITALLGGIPALVLLAWGRGRKTAIPYGPPLIVGAWAAIVFGPQLIG